MQSISPLKIGDLPKPPSFLKLIGPSFIILGMGLGSGELILWPYLSSNFGLGIIWAAILGISFQFFINMEIERYTLATGESVFVGFLRKFGRFTPYWFILSTLLPWIWPGIIASSAKLFTNSIGIEYRGVYGVIFLFLIGGFYSLGKVIYKTQEKLQKIIIILGVPFIFILTLYLASAGDWYSLLKGVIGKGEGFTFLPRGLPVVTFLAALAYAGAGGNLNLAQSLYIKEKGYGMGKYSGRLTGLFNSNKEEVSLTGTTFEINNQNISIFKQWWRKINIEHAIVFWFTGAFTMLLLSLLAYTTVYGKSGVETSINFIIGESLAISQRTFPMLGKVFLLMCSIMLFGTQFAVFGSNSRIVSENLMIINPSKFHPGNLSRYFFLTLWIQLFAGMAVFGLGFTEPLTLVIVGAVMNAISMFIYTGMLIVMNNSLLPKEIRPSNTRLVFVVSAFLFYFAFCLYTVTRYITS